MDESTNTMPNKWGLAFFSLALRYRALCTADLGDGNVSNIVYTPPLHSVTRKLNVRAP